MTWCLLGGSDGVVNSLDFCPASLKSIGWFYFRCVLSSQWKAVTENLWILHCQLYGHFWRPVVKMCLATSSNLLLVLWDAPKRIFSTNSCSSGQPKHDPKTLFSTTHPLSPVFFATATVLAFVLLRNSRFSFHCYSFIHSVKQRLLRNQPGSDAATSCTKDYKGHSPVQTSFTEPPNSETQLH